jgi:hypothetical protein
MRLRTIRSVTPLPPTRLRLVWDDGTDSELDLTPVLAKGGVFAFLHDPAAFATVTLGPGGRTLLWHDPAGDVIDLCTDALWRLAQAGDVEAA